MAARWVHGGLAALASLASCVLALQHPLWPTAMLTIWALWVLWLVTQPGVWLWLLPAALPLSNLSPWTGWLIFEEFDLLVGGVLCALHARQCWQTPSDTPSRPQSAHLSHLNVDVKLAAALWLLVIVGLLVGLSSAPRGTWSLFAAHEDALWSLRASKGLFWSLLLWPWMRRELAQAPRLALHRLGHGMVFGLGIVTAASIHERLAYPGLFDFVNHYRTTALFWEMHVGGAAIDAYIAFATPFAIWALWRAHASHHVLRWFLASGLAVGVAYACLTTFARGAYMAVSVSLVVVLVAIYAQLASQGRAPRWMRWLLFGLTVSVVVGFTAVLSVLSFDIWGAWGLLLSSIGLLAILGWLQWSSKHQGWRLPASIVLATVLCLEVLAVVGGDSFMASRIDDGPADLDTRMAHWRHSVGLLETPQEWIFGLGAGRFPAAYAASAPTRDFSGRLDWTFQAPNWQTAQQQNDTANSSSARQGMAVLHGPLHRSDLGGLYSATQRVPLPVDGHYSVRLTARARSDTQLLVRVCERHLLYDRNCQSLVITLQATQGNWNIIDKRLLGPHLDAGSRWHPRRGVLSLAVMNNARTAEIDRVELINPQGIDVLRNGDFSRQLAHWFPSAQRYYLPWHTDNLLLELLIERGLLGALIFAALLANALICLWRALPTPTEQGGSLVPILMASIAAMVAVGLVSSVLDVPRLSFLAFFLCLVACSLNPKKADKR
jgi:hypothetical protein